jgi:hypothetical protein
MPLSHKELRTTQMYLQFSQLIIHVHGLVELYTILRVSCAQEHQQQLILNQP